MTGGDAVLALYPGFKTNLNFPTSNVQSSAAYSRYSIVQYSTVQCSTVQCSTAQYNTGQDSIVLHIPSYPTALYLDVVVEGLVQLLGHIAVTVHGLCVP